MIVKEIKKFPLAVLECFDYLNNYDDTIKYAEANCPEITVEMLKQGYIKFRKSMAGFNKGKRK